MDESFGESSGDAEGDGAVKIIDHRTQVRWSFLLKGFKAISQDQLI